MDDPEQVGKTFSAINSVIRICWFASVGGRRSPEDVDEQQESRSRERAPVTQGEERVVDRSGSREGSAYL